MIADRMLDRCPVECDSELIETNIRLSEGNLLQCPACGQLISQIEASEFQASMREFDTETGTLPGAVSQERHDRRAARMFARIKQLAGLPVGQRLRLLDVGCSTGALMISARGEGIEVEGVEPATRAAHAAQAAGLKVFAGTLAEAALPSSEFHAATLIEVIEHLARPGDVLREIRRILMPNGVLAIGTGNAASWTVRLMGGEWDYFQVGRHGGHISFFTPESLRRLAVRCGFRVERIETRHVRFVESYQATKPVYRTLKIIAEVLNGPARWTNKGHDMLMYLRKV
jgi:2-polyprenyl-3-methyl-5-hydroxy-6-metoxy-1,4-benzoquinol methylase